MLSANIEGILDRHAAELASSAQNRMVNQIDLIAQAFLQSFRTQMETLEGGA
jgi:beta-N-acetylglucosaminidase